MFPGLVAKLTLNRPQKLNCFMTILGESMSAEDAKECGLIWNIVDDSELVSFANALPRLML
jgi:enoyl-CoA hydratase/carnithine racemase